MKRKSRKKFLKAVKPKKLVIWQYSVRSKPRKLKAQWTTEMDNNIQADLQQEIAKEITKEITKEIDNEILASFNRHVELRKLKDILGTYSEEK